MMHTSIFPFWVAKWSLFDKRLPMSVPFGSKGLPHTPRQLKVLQDALRNVLSGGILWMTGI